MSRARWIALSLLAALSSGLPAAAQKPDLTAAALSAQWQVSAKAYGEQLPLASTLRDAAATLAPLGARLRAHDTNALAAVAKVLVTRGFQVDEEARIQVVVSGEDLDSELPKGFIEGYGGLRGSSWLNQHVVWMPADALEPLARALPAGYFVRPAWPLNEDATGGECAYAMNTVNYQNYGLKGQGVVIGIIDGGFSNLASAIASGDVPPVGQILSIIDYINTNFSATVAFISARGTSHGTEVFEGAADNAPSANYRLYRTGNAVDLGLAIQHAISNGVDLLSMSQSFYAPDTQTGPGDGWYDNTGLACLAALAAASNDIPFFVSAGNRAGSHWKGNMNYGPDADNEHDWEDGDEFLSINFNVGGGALFYLSWEPAASRDYDLYLWSAPTTNSVLFASSVNSTNNIYESFSYKPTVGGLPAWIQVVRRGGVPGPIELFVHANGGGVSAFEYPVAESSATSPSNADHPFVISVGAVNWTNYASSAGSTGIIESFSSRGPSNSGRVLPDICAPDGNTTFVGGGPFFGTSDATPEAAGATAAFWSSVPTMSASGIVHLVRYTSEALKDFGDPGKDNIYGHGGLFLYAYRTNTIWVDRRAGNTTDATDRPFYHMAAAQSNATAGGRTVILGQSYPEPIVLNKAQRIETIVNPARIAKP